MNWSWCPWFVETLRRWPGLWKASHISRSSSRAVLGSTEQSTTSLQVKRAGLSATIPSSVVEAQKGGTLKSPEDRFKSSAVVNRCH